MWDRHVERPGFRPAVAIADDGGLAGFVYGYTGAAGQWWTDRAAEVLLPDVAQEWLGGHLEVVSIAVALEHRGNGIGRRLLERFLTGAEHRRGVLMTTADPADPAHRLYRQTGWEILGTGLREGTVIMGRRLDENGSKYR